MSAHAIWRGKKYQLISTTDHWEETNRIRNVGSVGVLLAVDHSKKPEGCEERLECLHVFLFSLPRLWLYDYNSESGMILRCCVDGGEGEG